MNSFNIPLIADNALASCSFELRNEIETFWVSSIPVSVQPDVARLSSAHWSPLSLGHFSLAQTLSPRSSHSAFADLRDFCFMIHKKKSFSRMKNIIIKNYSLWEIFLLLLMMYSCSLVAWIRAFLSLTGVTLDDEKSSMTRRLRRSFLSLKTLPSKRSSKWDFARIAFCAEFVCRKKKNEEWA